MNLQFKRGWLKVLLLIFIGAGLGLFCLMPRPMENIVDKTMAKGRATDEMPKSVTRRVYHENLAGVGRLDDYVIPASLTPRFAGFEGKYVEVVTPNLSRTEWANGPIVLNDIDEIRPLPLPPIEIDVNVQRTIADEQSLDVLFSFRNTSNAPVTIATNAVCIGFLDYRDDRDDENPDGGSPSIIEDTGYTVRQMLYGGTPSSPSDGFGGMQFQNYLDGLRQEVHGLAGSPISMRSDPSAGMRFLLLPGESVPYLWRTSVSKPGRRELAVRYFHYVPETRSYIPIQAWKTIDVSLLSERSNSKPLTIRAGVTTELSVFGCAGDWRKTHWIEGRLINDTGSPRHIFGAPVAAGVCLPGEILLYGENGERINGSVEWPVSDRNCTQQSIGQEGIPFCFRVWQDAITPGPPRIDRIEFWTITDAGLEKLTVAKDIPFVEFPDPEWGPAVQGTRCRIRLVRNRFSAGDEISFGFEVESDQKVCEVLHPHFDLSFDGKLVPWIDANDWTFPFRMGLSLRDLSKRDEVQLTPGRHKLQVTVRGNPGNRTDTKGRIRPHFEGTMLSNELEIEIVEAGEH